MRALVTGATGFVGSHVAEELVRRGHEVRCLVRPASDRRWLEEQPITYVLGDVTEPQALAEAIEDVDAVFHVAGITKALSPQVFERVNAEGTRNVLEAAARRPGAPPRVIYVSSLAAVGPAPEAGRLRRAVVDCRPVSSYGASKAAGEAYARAYAGRVPVTIVRPPIVYGPRDTEVLELFRMAAYGIVLQAGTTRRLFSVVHVADLVRLIVDAGERGRAIERGRGAAGVYFAADEGPYTWTDLARAAGEAFGKRVRVVPMPEVVTYAAALGGELLGLVRKRPSVLNLDKAREGTAGDWTCSAEEARRELGFEVRFPLERGFRETARWYKERRWL